MNGNVCVYSFADATGLTKYVDDVGDFVYDGTWSGGGTYVVVPLNAVSYGNALYMCIRDNVGDNPQRVPTRTRPQSWSILSLLYEYQCSGTTTDTAAAAYALAQTGTNIAWAAYYLAQIGTNTGSAAYDLAGSAYALAGSAFTLAGDAYAFAGDAYYLAQTGTNIANDAYAIAVAGTNAAATAQSTSDAAYRLAQIGTNTGTAALNAAAAAQNTANGAFFIAVAGTNAAATAQSTADAAYALAQIGTNVGTAALTEAIVGHSIASAAYALAELGTIPPPLSTLPDVSIPAPTANQVLTFNGSVWVANDAPSQVAPGAFTLFLEDSPSGTAGYATLLSVPSGLPEDADTVFVGGTVPFVLVEGYISSPINRTRIDAGIWEFSTYLSSGSSTFPINSVAEIYIRDINGAETLLFAGTSPAVNSETPVLSTTIISSGSYLTNLTDKLVAKYYFLRTDSPVTVAALYHSGSEHDSHIHTPIGFAHNDLGGLQGGSTDQFYHVTLDQNQALVGNLGYPSATNRFVTEAGLNYLDGTLTSEIGVAYALAQIGTNTGTAALNAAATAQNTADAAYALAQIGTNTGTAALAAAATAQNTADTAYFIAQVGTNTGTAAYNLAQSGSNYAAAAYALAQIGTAIPNYYYGGTMYGPLTVPNVVVSVGSTATFGTVYYDFNGPAYQTTAVSGGPLILNGTNFTTGAEIAVVLISSGTTQPLYFANPLSAATTWVGTTPPLQIYAKDIIIAFTCISAAPVTVYACQATEP